MLRSLPAAVLLAATLVVPALAEEDLLDKPISLNLEDASVEQLYPLFATILEAQLELDEADNDRSVSLVFDGITVRTSLNAFCESAGCVWELTDTPTRTLRFSSRARAVERTRAMAEDRRITVDVEDADAPRVFELAARLLGAQAAVDPVLKERKVTMRMEEEPISTVLDELCLRLSCDWSLVAGTPARLRIEPASD